MPLRLTALILFPLVDFITLNTDGDNSKIKIDVKRTSTKRTSLDRTVQVAAVQVDIGDGQVAVTASRGAIPGLLQLLHQHCATQIAATNAFNPDLFNPLTCNLYVFLFVL